MYIKKYPIMIIIVLLLLMFNLVSCQKDSGPKEFSKEEYDLKDGKHIVAKKDDERIDINIYYNYSDFSDEFISDSLLILYSLYDTTPSPYPGRISNLRECRKEFKPLKNNISNYYVVYATERFTYGACSWDLINYSSILYYHKCGEDLIEMKYFFALKENTTEKFRYLENLGCKFVS